MRVGAVGWRISDIDDVEIQDGDVYPATVTAPGDPDLVLASRKAPVDYERKESWCDTGCYTANY